LLQKHNTQIGPTTAGEIDRKDWHGATLLPADGWIKHHGGKFKGAIY
jgi:hypothetical protein